MPYQGHVHVPQRFAIDFVRLQEDGETHHGDPKDNRNCRCYGAEALAVANARVADVRDGIPESKPDATERAVKMTLDTVSGNRVTLELGGGASQPTPIYSRGRSASTRVTVCRAAKSSDWSATRAT